MLTVICVSFIEVEEFDGNVSLNVITSGYQNIYYCVILRSNSHLHM